MSSPELTNGQGLPASAGAWQRSRFGSLDQGVVDRRERAVIRRLLDPYQGRLESVLDAPAGYGRLTEILSSLAPQRVVALDLHPGRLRCLPAQPRVLRVLADLDQLPFAAQSFDLVLCIRHMQHLRGTPAQSTRLAQLASLSRRLLLVSYYAPGGLHGLQRQILQLSGKRKRALGFVAQGWIRRALEDLGFRVRCDRALLPGLHAQRLLLAERSI